MRWLIPLNQLMIENVMYPEHEEVVPLLLCCICYDTHIDKAMNQIFGKKILAKSIKVASTFSASHGMNTITLDGDLCSHKGTLSGLHHF